MFGHGSDATKPTGSPVWNRCHRDRAGLVGRCRQRLGARDDKDSLEVIETAVELDVDFFEIADVYGDGHSAELLGRAMRDRGDRFVVATKIGWAGFDHESRRHAIRRI